MIKLFLSLILILIALPLYANPCMQIFMSGSTSTAAPPAACTTAVNPQDMGASDGDRAVFRYTTSDWWSSAFIAGKTTTICQVCVKLKLQTETAPDYNITLYLYANSVGDDASTVLANGNYGTIAASTLSTTYQSVCFTGGSAAVENTVRYHIVLASSGVAEVNYVNASYDSTCTTEDVEYSANGASDGSWVSMSTAYCLTAELYE